MRKHDLSFNIEKMQDGLHEVHVHGNLTQERYLELLKIVDHVGSPYRLKEIIFNGAAGRLHMQVYEMARA